MVRTSDQHREDANQAVRQTIEAPQAAELVGISEWRGAASSLTSELGGVCFSGAKPY